MKKDLLLVALFTIISVSATVSAEPIKWETVSPTADGVLTYTFEEEFQKVYLGTDANQHGQAVGTYGAGFYTESGGILDFSVVLRTWDSWGVGGDYDRLMVTTSSESFFWESYQDPTQETIIQLGGKSWTDGVFEKYGFQNSLSLEAGTYFSFFLETTRDTLYSSEAMGKFNFSPNEPVNPVPEPATMILFGAGLAGLAGISRRRK